MVLNRYEYEDESSLHGKRILLVEDAFLVALMIRRMLADLGCEVVGPVPSVEDAMRVAMQEPLDGAILDINIVGGTSAPVAQCLQRKGVPFFFVTGYGSPDSMLPAELAAVHRLTKPVDRTQLARVMHAEFGEDRIM